MVEKPVPNDKPKIASTRVAESFQADWHADAAIAARRAIYLDRRYVMAHMLLGGSLSRIGDATGARRAFDNVLALLAETADDHAVPGADGVPVARLREAASFHRRARQTAGT